MQLQNGNFHWWEGVVEDNLDPTGAGRCKVRVIGHNTPLKADLSRVELPWAYPVLPLNNPHGKIVALKPGTRVMGFYRDGTLGQDLVMMGTINTGYGTASGYNEDEDPVEAISLADPVDRGGDIGFVDDRQGVGGPIENQPQKSLLTVVDAKLVQENISDYGSLRVNEINTPRLARGQVAETITQAHRDLQISTHIIKPDLTLMSEPATPFAAKYPYNTVEESDSGHVKEVDDTPGAERIKESHRTGTFYEIHPDGTKVTKVVNDEFSVTIGDKGVKVEGVCAVHIGGTADVYCESDINVKTEMNATIDVKMNATALVEGNVSSVIQGNLVATSAGDIVVAGASVLVTGAEQVDLISGGALNILAAEEIVFSDATATAGNVQDIIKDVDDDGDVIYHGTLP